MKTISSLAPLLLLIFACRLCSMTGSNNLDPYKGSIKDLLPNEPSVGLIKFKLDTSQSDDLDGAQEAVKANYTMQAGSISVPVQLQVANFASSQEAEAAMQAIASKHNLVLEQRPRARGPWDGDSPGATERQSCGQTAHYNASPVRIFAKTTSNLEEALPF